MSLNASDDLDGLGMSNVVSEDSEQQREDASATTAAIQRTQKDEKKIRRFDVWLAALVKTLLEQSVYDHIITQLTPLLNARCPSHILLAYLLPLSDATLHLVRTDLGLPAAVLPTLPAFSERMPYSEPLDPQISAHLNIWMDTVRGCITIDPSQTATQAMVTMINSTHEEGLVKLVAHVLAHFLYDRGVNISPPDAARVARGVIKKMMLLVQGIQIDSFFSTDPEAIMKH